MHSIEFPYIDKRIWIPENLGECTKQQYLDISKLVLMYQMAEIDLKEFRVLALYNLMNMVPSESMFESAEEEKWENIYMASEVLNSFFRLDDDKRMHLIQDYIHNPVKSFSYKLHTFYGPQDAFQGMTYGQLEDGVGEMQNYVKTGDFEHMVRLFAIFYLRPHEKYSKVNMDKRIKFFDLLDVRYVYGFYLLFVSFFNFLTKECVILVDGKEIDLRLLFQADPNQEQPEPTSNEPESLTMRSTSFQLAESGVFGTLKEMREEDAMMILIRMHDLLIRSRKEEAERKAQEEKAKNKN